LVGSLCSAVIISTLFHLPDPRTAGSNNPGATNVLRLSGKFYAILVLVADLLKGTLPVLLARILGADDITLSWMCLAAVLGHIYPVFFNFKGGKGVATAIGSILGLHVGLGGSVIATWIIVAFVSHYSSLASILAIGLMPEFAFWVIPTFALLPLSLMTLIVLWQHRENFKRLIAGTESKLNLGRGNP
ncbi:MAG: acyl-phosphate glycerol 3-phosphate acyltransferase, partial [Legionella sp. 21-45-4]